MQTILKIVELGRSIRIAKNMKVKLPLQQIIVIVLRSEEEQLLNDYTVIIKDELNVKDVVYTEDLSQYESTVFKLNFKTAGAAFGKLVNAVKQYVDHILDSEKRALLDRGQLHI
jgi:isoleucyl-tRNA synthetase